MIALELLKEYIAKLCMSFNGVWISQEELDEAAKELEKIVKENSKDRLAELEKVILDYYLVKGYKVNIGGWGFKVNISTYQKQKEIQIMFRENRKSNYETVFRIWQKTTKEMFDAAFEYFSIKDKNGNK